MLGLIDSKTEEMTKLLKYEDFKRTYKFKDDEEADSYGLPFCSKCMGERYLVIRPFDTPLEEQSKIEDCYIISSRCSCQEEEMRLGIEAETRKKFVDDFHKRQELSFLGLRYRDVMFSTSTVNDTNRDAYERAKKYVENAKEMIANDIGVYIYGAQSSGKTYLSACLCNELLYKERTCVYTNLSSLLSELYQSKQDDCPLLQSIKHYDFAFIDDLGKEFIGREYNKASAKWAEEKLFEIINARYNAKKPTIFSSNFSIKELSTILGLDRAIIDRIDEMATCVIKLDEGNFRKENRKDKVEIAKKWGVI